MITIALEIKVLFCSSKFFPDNTNRYLKKAITVQCKGHNSYRKG